MTVSQFSPHPPSAALSRVEAPRTSLFAGIRLATRTLLGIGGVRHFRAQMLANKSTLNETLPVHSKWWREHARGEGELLYVAIGDSAAQGIGASRPDHSYVGQLAAGLRAASGRSVRVINLSVAGATTALAVRDQLPTFRALSTQPSFVTVSIGANDIAAWDAAAFDRSIHQIFSAVPTHAVVAELPCFYFPGNERKVAEANRILHATAREYGLTVAPLHEATRRQGMRGILTEFAPDMFHPNDHGYTVWARAFWPALAARLGQLQLVSKRPDSERELAQFSGAPASTLPFRDDSQHERHERGASRARTTLAS